MRSIKIGLALMAALAFSAAMTASASAAGFLATAKEKLLSAKVAAQVFTTKEGTFECSEATIERGESSTSEVQTQLAVVHYGGCTFFSFIAEFTPADFLFEANGNVKLANLIKITAPGTSCEMSWPAQTFGTVKYDNSGKNILLLPNVSGMVYDAAGCSTGNGLFSDGTYKGNFEVMIANGKLSFMP